MSSPTVPTGGQTEADVLDVRAAVWQRRPLLREIYQRYFAEMVANFSRRAGAAEGPYGTVVEIGGGSGNFKDYFARAHAGQARLIATDIVPTPHCDLAADAMALPFADATIDHIILQDVLHHVPYPLRFFAEAERVLRPGGRLVMTEPYISPASRIMFAVGHPEPVDMKARVFGEAGVDDPSPLRGKGAFASNQATPTLIFGRDRRKFAARFPALKVVAVLRRSVLVYPLSGGFSGPKILPRFLEGVGWGLERLLLPLGRLLACRVLVVLEKR